MKPTCKKIIATIEIFSSTQRNTGKIHDFKKELSIPQFKQKHQLYHNFTTNDVNKLIEKLICLDSRL